MKYTPPTQYTVLITLLFFLFSLTQTNAQDWIWLDGGNEINQPGNYGEIFPGARQNSISWVDASNDFWLFGGKGKDKGGNTGNLNDLWKYNMTQDEWTWVSGSDQRYQSGVYGIKGIPSESNIPGARENSISWVGASGDFWLFGGEGKDKDGNTGNLNDLWKYNTTQDKWTWVSGSDQTNQSGVYGIKGTPSGSNFPGARRSAISWVDGIGNLWLFGGGGFNDLWKYNIAQDEWTWVSGSDQANQSGIYGTKGTSSASNIPGARSELISWIDASGDHWVFGGFGYDKNGNRSSLNDLWKYDISNNQWTWVSGSDQVNQAGIYGTKGTPSASNIPGARLESISWVDGNGDFWLFGGWGYDKDANGGNLSDLWKYDISNDQWTWVSGFDQTFQLGVYGIKGTPSGSNIPGARTLSISWVDVSGNFWLFGGLGYDNDGIIGGLNDLWKFNVITWEWTWVNGSDEEYQAGVYDPLIASLPGSRNNIVSWQDPNNNYYIFGGNGLDINESEGLLNDLWKYDGNNWMWLNGSDTKDQSGIYGAKNIAKPSNIPGARKKATAEQLNTNTSLLFGGTGYDVNSVTTGYLNDLWYYNSSTTFWTWISGDNVKDQGGVYGTKGTPSPLNNPGGRKNSVSWIDANGVFWLFGGLGLDENATDGYLNDLWNFENGDWTWRKGKKLVNNSGIYGTINTANSNNLPGARHGSTSWIDDNGDLWLFGGYGYDKNGSSHYLNDLWKFDPLSNHWIWKSGSDAGTQLGEYFSAPINLHPGSRFNSMSWIDSNGDLMLFGGYGAGSIAGAGKLNDLWKYDISSGLWTFLKGSATVDETADFGTKDIPATTNVPGGTMDAAGWIDTYDNLHLFSGEGFDDNGSNGDLNSLWKFGIPSLNINITTLLEGPHSSGTNMSTNVDLSTQLSQPYSSLHSGTESVASGFFTSHTDLVDWIVIELRTGTDAVSKIDSRAAFLKDDGTIVDLDGFSPVKFDGLTPGNYYVVVHHRNHLSIMSANVVPVN